jgi:hypothetical protein
VCGIRRRPAPARGRRADQTISVPGCAHAAE